MVPNRSCGGCVVCCIVPPVKSPDFSKTSGTPCLHCVETFGCAIHASRPQVCRDWLCGWRSLPFLDDRWRPDNCGLLIVPEEDDIPVRFERRVGLNIVVFRSGADLDRQFVIEMLAGLVFGKVPTFLSAPGPPSFHFAKGLLNPLIEQAAEDQDGAKIRSTVLSLHDHLTRGSFEPVSA
jgi:hypothetical protein